MKITPKKEEEFNRFEELPPGEYPFTILDSTIAKSKSEKNPGKEFVKVKLNVHGPKFDRHIYDQFGDFFSEWKLRHILESTGHLKEYESGNIDPDGGAWANRTGWVKVGVRKKDGSKYEGQNEVVDYIVKNKEAAAQPPKPPEDDSVPF